MIARMSNTAAALVLYAITLAGQWFAAVARWILVYLALEIVRLLTGWPIPSNPIALGIAFLPLVVSLLALLCPLLIAPIDGRWWEISTGGRAPEEDEHEAFEHAIGQLREIDPGLRIPKHWFVAEESAQNAAAYSSSMRVDRGLLESPYAAAVIAHELGHLNSSDARLTSALNLMVLAPMQTPTIHPLYSLPLRGLAWVASGQADEGHTVADAYGVWVEKSMYGRTYFGNERTTFVIGPEGKVAEVLRKVKPAEHDGLVLAALERLIAA
jgi:hypothetical protein